MLLLFVTPANAEYGGIQGNQNKAGRPSDLTEFEELELRISSFDQLARLVARKRIS